MVVVGLLTAQVNFIDKLKVCLHACMPCESNYYTNYYSLLVYVLRAEPLPYASCRTRHEVLQAKVSPEEVGHGYVMK